MNEKAMPRLVAVIGNGIIGHGVAEVFASAGINVVMIGRSTESLAHALGRIEASLNGFVAHELVRAEDVPAILQRVRTSTDIDDAAQADLVIEALPEDMALKVATFRQLDAITAPDAILASASGHPASEVAAEVARRERVIATHFWYPPQLLPLVEVCGAPETSQPVIERTLAILKGVGKEPVLINREIAGFIGNRLQFAILREAWALWADGVASAEAIDKVVKHSIGRRLGVTGPIESADLAGLDTMVRFAEFLLPDLNRSRVPAPKVDALRKDHRGNEEEPIGVTGMTQKQYHILLEARRAELFRWLKADRRKRVPTA